MDPSSQVWLKLILWFQKRYWKYVFLFLVTTVLFHLSKTILKGDHSSTISHTLVQYGFVVSEELVKMLEAYDDNDAHGCCTQNDPVGEVSLKKTLNDIDLCNIEFMWVLMH